MTRSNLTSTLLADSIVVWYLKQKDGDEMDKTIEYVLEVAQCGSIAKAAKNLFITPSALSKFILQKERELGVHIFHRDGKKFVLTYPGERYVEMLTEIQGKQEKMQLEMSRLADMYSGRLRAGFQMALSEFIVCQIVPELQDEFPSIRIFLEEGNNAELKKMLQRNQLDIVLAMADGEPSDDIHCERILKSPVVIVAAKGSPLSRKAVEKEGFSFPWLSDETILQEKIVFDKGERSFRKYAAYLLNRGKTIVRSEITVTNARTALRCVAGDLGIIVLPECLVKALHFQDEVELYSYGETELYEYLCVLSDPKTVLVSEIEAFSKIVARHLNYIDCKVDKT